MPTKKQLHFMWESNFEHKPHLPISTMKKYNPISKVSEFLYDGEILHALKLNSSNISGYIRWRRKLFTEAYENLQSVGHPNGFHHVAVFRIMGLIKLYDFNTIMNDLDNKLFDDVAALTEGDILYVFENFTLKYQKHMDELGYVFQKEIYHSSSGFPIILDIKPENEKCYLLIENEADNWNFDKFKDSNDLPADYYKVCNFATKDVVDFVIKLNDLSQKYKQIKVWFETEDLGGKYSELFKKMIISDVIPKNLVILPTGKNEKFIKLMSEA